MKKSILSFLAILSLIFATNMLTACDDDDDDSETTGTINGYEYVDLGLSVKWATVNIGATLPADYGNYYAWGETETKDEYTSDNSVTLGDSSISSISSDATYDAATANWGGTWRMPTIDECENLANKCTWTWTTQKNSDGEEINGYLVEGTNGNSIFLPAAGYRSGSSLNEDGTKGMIWSSSLYYLGSGDRCSYSLIYDSKYDEYYTYALSRCYGVPVRPVSK